MPAVVAVALAVRFGEAAPVPPGVEALGERVLPALLLSIPNPNPEADDLFGASVADLGGNVLVGAPGNDLGPFGSINDAGSAYLFNGSTGDLLLNIPNPDPEADDEFGTSVAALGGNVVVGAPNDDAGTFVSIDGAGAVHVFNGVTGAKIMTILNPEPETGDLFGSSVAAVGEKILVGAHSDDAGSVDGAGAVHLFDGSTGGLLLSIPNPDPEADDYFGVSVAALGGNVLAGAPGNDVGFLGSIDNAGSAYLFDGTTGALVKTITNPNPEANDGFGRSVAALGGSNILVGAYNDAAGAVDDAGAAYVFGELPPPPPPLPLPPPAPPQIAASQFRRNGVARVRVRDAVTGALRKVITPFPGYDGRLRLLLRDVNGDLARDLIALITSGNPRKKVYDALSLALLPARLT